MRGSQRQEWYGLTFCNQDDDEEEDDDDENDDHDEDDDKDDAGDITTREIWWGKFRGQSFVCGVLRTL